MEGDEESSSPASDDDAGQNTYDDGRTSGTYPNQQSYFTGYQES
jgi:hypothetical protein